MDEMKEMFEELEKMFKSGNVSSDISEEKKKENLKEAFKNIKEELDSGKTNSVIFASDERCITVGKAGDLLSGLSALLHSMKKFMPTELLIHSVLLGICMNEEINEIDKKELKKILEAIKELN